MISAFLKYLRPTAAWLGLVVVALPGTVEAMPVPLPFPAGDGGFEIVGGYPVYRFEAGRDNGCPVFYTTLPVTLTLTTYDPTVSLYQASQSITLVPGYSTVAGASVVMQILPNGYGVPQATNLTGTADANINWIQSTNYDETGTVIKDSKQFFDGKGRPTQTQSKAFYRATPNTELTHVLATQTIRDVYGRDVATSLPAPIDYADFSYRSNFLQHNSAGVIYNHQNFDLSTSGDKTNTPDAIWDATSGTPVQGTLAWYYSASGRKDTYTPVTNYQYTRQTYYQDQTGNKKKSAGLGDQLKMGMGRETISYVTPVADEAGFLSSDTETNTLRQRIWEHCPPVWSARRYRLFRMMATAQR